MGAKRRGVTPDINVTPMADVMIVLLIIFMIAVPAMGRPPVALPEAAHAREHHEETIVVVVKATGDVSVGTDAMPSLAALDSYVRARVDGAAGTVPILVQADREASYASVARVLQACQQAGVGDIGLATRPRVGL